MDPYIYLYLIDSNQSITQLKHVVTQRNDYELCIFCTILEWKISSQVKKREFLARTDLNVVSNYGNISKVQGCVYFVHDIQRRWPKTFFQ